MTKELFVSSTPHETKVGMVEDDQLAEVYLERENEYTLAGSIYKGRVTRVLPGMQSAFVDIGLERDAFLYVSDFMELENQDEDLDEIPAIAAVPEFRSPQPVPPAPVESRSEADAQPGAVSQGLEVAPWFAEQFVGAANNPLKEIGDRLEPTLPIDEPVDDVIQHRRLLSEYGGRQNSMGSGVEIEPTRDPPPGPGRLI